MKSSAYDQADPFEELARSFIRVSFVFRRELEGELTGLSSVPREVLRIVVRDPGLSVAAIARVMGKQVSNTSIAVNQLARHGLVGREPDPSDRRMVRVFPTNLAVAQMRRLYGRWARELQAWCEQLPPDQREQVIAAINPLTSLTSIAEQRLPPDHT